ncbi:hypothetical protein Tco_1413852, partial [Tanacetum coccineum]
VTEQWVRQQQAVAVPQLETPRPLATYTRDIPALGQNQVGVVTVAPRGQGNLSCSGPTTPGDPMSDKYSNELDIFVCVTPDSSESDMTVSKNPK